MQGYFIWEKIPGIYEERGEKPIKQMILMGRVLVQQLGLNPSEVPLIDCMLQASTFSLLPEEEGSGIYPPASFSLSWVRTAPWPAACFTKGQSNEWQEHILNNRGQSPLHGWNQARVTSKLAERIQAATHSIG